MGSFHLHLISDSTGETICTAARASLVQFDDVETEEHLWSMVRSREQVSRVIEAIKDNPGVVLYTLVNEEVRAALEEECERLNVPCIGLLDPVVEALAAYFDTESKARPGQQHALDAEYFERIDAMQFALAHDDGQSTWDLSKADIILIGVSRTSKTPTCIYLANRGLKAANVPLVPGCPIPQALFESEHALIVGLTKDPKRLVEIRRQRLKLLDQDENTDYVDLDMVSKEINDARRLFTKHGWPVINVSRKSIEETASTIMQLYTEKRESTV